MKALEWEYFSVLSLTYDERNAKYNRSADVAENGEAHATSSFSINIEVVLSVMEQDYPCDPRRLQRTTFKAWPKYLFVYWLCHFRCF